MFDPQLLTNGSSYADINAAAVKDRRRAARVNLIDGLRQQRAELQSRLATQRRQLALGDGSAALSVKRNEQRVAELTAQIDAAIENLQTFDSAPAGDFLDGDTKPAPKAKTAKELK